MTREDLKQRDLPLNPYMNDLLRYLGYTTKPAGYGRKHILSEGNCVFTGRVEQVWAWLREGGVEVVNLDDAECVVRRIRRRCRREIGV